MGVSMKNVTHKIVSPKKKHYNAILSTVSFPKSSKIQITDL